MYVVGYHVSLQQENEKQVSSTSLPVPLPLPHTTLSSSRELNRNCMALQYINPGTLVLHFQFSPME